MSLYVRFTSLIRNLFRKERVDRDLDAELRAYIDQLMQEKIEAGMPPEKARREACLELGGIEQVKDEVRDARTAVGWTPFTRSSLRVAHAAQEPGVHRDCGDDSGIGHRRDDHGHQHRQQSFFFGQCRTRIPTDSRWWS